MVTLKYFVEAMTLTDISTLQHEMDGDESGAQEERAEDLDTHMQAMTMIEWAGQVNAKRLNQTL